MTTKTMKTIDANELLAVTDIENTKYLGTNYKVKVKCHDGTKVTTARHLQYLHGFLHFNRKYDVPVSVEQVFPPGFIHTPKAHKLNMELAIKVVFDAKGGLIPKPDIAMEWTKCADTHINASIEHLERWAASIDAEDFIEILEDPVIIEMRTEMKTILASDVGPEIKSNAINETNFKFIAHIKDQGLARWPHNGIVQHIQCDSIKLDQLCQLANVVGYVTEIDSEIYPYPTAESFAEGMNYAYTYSTNASLGKKSIIYNKSPIGETETLNRLIQQMASQVETVHIGDCGSTETSPILVTDLTAKALDGLFHIKNNGRLELITARVAKENKGKVLYVRTVAGCKHKDPSGVCSTCGGANTNNFVKNYTIGGASSSLIFGRNSQKILKTKHVDLISFREGAGLSPSLAKYLHLSDNGKDIFVDEDCSKATFSFLSSRRTVKEKSTNGQFLQTVRSVSTLEGTQLESFGEVTRMSFNPNDDIHEEVPETELKMGSSANFSLDLLMFLRENPGALTQEKYSWNKIAYTINLDGFDISKAILNMPFKHYDALDLHKQLEEFFISPSGKNPGNVLTDYGRFSDALVKLANMTYPRLGVNMSVLQMVLLAFTVRDKEAHDYRMSFGGDTCTFGKLNDVRRERSLSVVTIATDQSSVYGHLSAVNNDHNAPHQYDIHYVS